MYAPPPYAQKDGSRYDDENCTWAVCTDLIDRATVGALRIGAPVLRAASGDTSGGSTYTQNADTTYRVTRQRGQPVILLPRLGLTREDVRKLGRAGKPFAISIYTGVTRPYPEFRTNWFIGGHSLYANGYDDPANEWRCDDPGTTAASYLMWPEDLLFRAAEARGGGRINVLVGPDTEDVWRVAPVASVVRAAPRTDAKPIGTTIPTHGYFVEGTENGGYYSRPDGSQANGWHRIRYGAGLGYVWGKGLR